MPHRVIAVALTGLVLAGCGGEGSNEDYLTEVNTVCRDASAALSQVPRPPSAAEAADYLEQTVGISRDAAETIAALTPPKGDEAAIAAGFTDPLRGRLQALTDLVPAVRADPEGALAAFDDTAGGRVDRTFLQTYGMTDCLDFATP